VIAAGTIAHIGQQGVPSYRALAARAIAVFVLARVVTLAWILGVGAHRSLPLSQTIGYWDGSWYIQAAKGGWPSVVPNLPPETAGQDTTAFFPGYPLLIRVAHAFGLNWEVSALVVVVLAGAAASILIAILIAQFSTVRIAVLTVALWSMQPESYVLSVAYSEALFTALAAGTLLALYRQRWLTAGVLAAAASATRSVAAALTIVAVVVAIRQWRATPAEQRWTARGLAPWLAPVLSPIGVLAYFAFLRARVGSWTAWFEVESKGWHMHSDPGISVVRNTWRAFAKTGRFFIHPRGTLIPEGMTPLVLIAAIALAVWLVVLARRGLVPLEFWLFGIAFLLLMFITGNSYASLPRILVPVFVLLFPVAHWLSSRSWPTIMAILVPSLAAACYLGVLWFDTIRLATHCCAP